MFDKIVANSCSIIAETTVQNIFVDVWLDWDAGNVLNLESVLGWSASAHGCPGIVALRNHDEVILVLTGLAAVQRNKLDIGQQVSSLGMSLHAGEQWIPHITQRTEIPPQRMSLEMLQQRLDMSVL